MKPNTFLPAAALLLSLAASAQAKAVPGVFIGTVTIESHNVFNTVDGPEAKWIYNAANSAHWQTHASVLSRELLFAAGAAYDPALLAETERNLRRLPFLRRADVQAVPNPQGNMDVVVRTYDAWTLELVAHFKRVGGNTNWKGGLAEHNLAGQGKTISAVYGSENGSESRSLSYGDPHLFGRKHLAYSLAAVAAPDSRFYAMSMSRPFYASIARSALGFTGSYGDERASTFAGTQVVGEVRKQTRELGVSYGVALGTSTHRTRRATVGLLHHRAEYSAVPGLTAGPIPNADQLGFLQLGLEYELQDFVKEQRVQKMSHDEDFNLGLGIFPSLAWAPYLRPMSTTEARILPKILVRKGFSGGGQLLLVEAGYRSTYVNGNNGNRVASLDALYFLRGLPRQTVAVHTAYEHGWQLDPASTLGLGESNGLRGYGLSQFTGERRFLFNVEDRVFIYDNLWRLLDTGAVVFFDSGFVWPGGRTQRVSDLKNSVGFGLRLAASKSASNTPVRIDFARALSDNRTGSPWTLSVLAGHAFGPGAP